ncbi:DnaJ-domain-containing protein [Pseudovirgaria hyperparasitica]|uniref:DnaJ-domain-containing protein n=1 Tax=Pseudovirgaria hyperparasitica TaxID=470096 RepID=A0A6A6WCP8_9PEZI|nr:DnaJ-domain-containing protein [Pseudovirgaria hyperparasitica]KAF2759626.1 DnaJ-domain-containing protein [Pseudovirgaria hyperparasitica]
MSDSSKRTHHDGSSTRAYTAEQKAAVLRIKRCAPTAFYEILGLEEVRSSCGDGEIKKAYRRLSLLTHPDKNGYGGADEAFKLVSRAFQVLSDPDKKAKYDKFGGDPDNRFAGASSSSSGASASPFSGFARSSHGGAGRAPMFEEEISPEEMFRQFFGGGMGGGGFGGPFGGFDNGPGFVFNLGGGGPGIRIHQFGGGAPRRRPQRNPDGTPAPQPSPISALSSLLPLLILFVLPLLSSLFSGATTPQGPSIRFAERAPWTMARTSERLSIPYWVNPVEVEDMSKKKWRALDEAAELRHIEILTQECVAEEQRVERMVQDAQGWFFVDEEKMALARAYRKVSCERRRALLGKLR